VSNFLYSSFRRHSLHEKIGVRSGCFIQIQNSVGVDNEKPLTVRLNSKLKSQTSKFTPSSISEAATRNLRRTEDLTEQTHSSLSSFLSLLLRLRRHKRRRHMRRHTRTLHKRRHNSKRDGQARAKFLQLELALG